MNSALIPRLVRNGAKSGTAVQERVGGALRRAAEEHRLNALVYLNGESAMSMAAEADESLRSGAASLLSGATVSIKDNFSVCDEPVAAASRILQGYVAPYDSTVAERIKLNKGVIFGRSNMDEHGMGSSSSNSPFGAVVNPWTASGGGALCAGGSSGGAAAAVAAGIVDVAIGSDTGGSVRHPASFCGVVGLKPSYGLIPRHGLLSYASSLDCPGVVARSTLDAAIALDALAGSDSRDPSAILGASPYANEYSAGESLSESTFAVGTHAAALLQLPGRPGPVAGALTAAELGERFGSFCADPASLRGVNVGIPDEFSVEGLHADVLAAWDDAVRMLVDAGAHVRRVSLPCIKLALPCYYVLACAEASSNLSRYDGIRYGYRHEGDSQAVSGGDTLNVLSEQSAEVFFGDLRKTRGRGFGSEVIRRILTGTFVLSQSAYHDYYESAARCRRMIHEDFNNCLSGSQEGAIHALIGPTTPGLPFLLSEMPDAPNMLLNDLYTIQANLAGIPAISVPVATSYISDGQQKVPIGVQLLGRYRDESRLLKIARAVEARSDFISKVPDHLKNVYHATL